MLQSGLPPLQQAQRDRPDFSRNGTHFAFPKLGFLRLFNKL